MFSSVGKFHRAGPVHLFRSVEQFDGNKPPAPVIASHPAKRAPSLRGGLGDVKGRKLRPALRRCGSGEKYPLSRRSNHAPAWSRLWTYVEVTQLNRSEASNRTLEILQRIADHVISVLKPFQLEVVFWREPMEGEEDDLARQACEVCQAADGNSHDVGDLASIIVKSGDPAVVIPSILPDNGTRMALAQSIVVPGHPNRQIVVRLPFADQRGEDILTAEARQLPRGASGLIMVNAGGQPTVFESWTQLVPRRFTPAQHTRVGGVLLFMNAITGTAQGVKWLPFLKMIPNPHARVSLPTWISEVVEETCTETRRQTGRPA